MPNPMSKIFGNFKATPLANGWEIEYDRFTQTKYFLRHCDKVVLMNYPKWNEAACGSCGANVPDEIVGLVNLCRWKP